MADKLYLNRLAELRNSKGLTQKAVADAIGIDDASYQRYEYGMREPKLSLAKALAVFFNVSLDYLVGLDDVPNRKNK